MLVDTFFEHQFYLKLRQDGFTASGKVVNIEKVSNGTSGVSWDYTVEYIDDKSNKYTVSNKYGSKKQEYNTGDTLQVVYNKQEPSKAVLKVELNSSFLRDYIVSGLMSSLLIVGFILYRKGKNKSNQ